MVTRLSTDTSVALLRWVPCFLRRPLCLLVLERVVGGSALVSAAAVKRNRPTSLIGSARPLRQARLPAKKTGVGAGGRSRGRPWQSEQGLSLRAGAHLGLASADKALA